MSHGLLRCRQHALADQRDRNFHFRDRHRCLVKMIIVYRYYHLSSIHPWRLLEKIVILVMSFGMVIEFTGKENAIFVVDA